MGQAYTVTEVNQYIKNMFIKDPYLNFIYIKGEVSNCKYHTSGHIYFTLKDTQGQLSCVMFAGQRRGLTFRLEEGQSVVVRGSVSVYERDGKYQVYANQIVLDGFGLLYERYEKLKKDLEAQGLFDKAHKKPIPLYPKRVGIVTASTGAAIQDIINISKRRNPYTQLILYPALVQGTGAASSIVKGIKALDKLSVDVIIIGRGGGSIEDLWAFNEEVVA
ncbi:MAG: exodeoxyribonuclease VII large subunit, partial [Clostridiales bacterium]|nr:exodeoxyribonuclease VII large subunit [Clostridiales bacterium]